MVVEVKPASVAQSTINQTDNVTCHICGNQMQALKTMQDAIIYECINCGPESDTLIFKPVESLLKPESGSQYYNYNEIESLLLNDKSDSKKWRDAELKTLLRYESIKKSQNIIDAYKVFLKKGVSFAKEVKLLTGMSEASSHRAIEELSSMNLIEPVTKVYMRKAAGGRPTLYGVSTENYTIDEQKEASARYLNTRTKTYKYVERVYNKTIQQVKFNEISFRNIVQICKEYGGRNVHFIDLANQVSLMLQEEKIQVIK